MNPLLSIVIANYNYGRFLPEAIESVLAQSCQDFEIIIIDGASTDNSVEVIKKYAGGLPPNTERFAIHCPPPHSTYNSLITFWCSEKDGGQSNAFNKGFSHAHGKFLTWLNADDVMLPGTIERLKRAAENHPYCPWFVGGVMWLSKDMKVRHCARAQGFSRIRACAGEMTVWGPSSFFTHELLDKVGGIDERFFYCMDNNLWLKFYFHAGVQYRRFTDYAWGLRMHETAKMSAHNFAESGQQDPDHPKWKRLRQEGLWNREIHPKEYELNLLRLLMSSNPIVAVLSRFDTHRYAGKPYTSCLKGGC